MKIIEDEEIERVLESNKDKEIIIKKMLEATQAHELLTNTFYEKNWSKKVKCFSQLHYLILN